ncbi:hypothetical protein E3V39_01420 [Gammaproteobacteria bacterium LSUCC0112]|nr:hypothetical protein E3V39_01420 [Gammaproteobacteria bacterium LSUCC0112]
MTDTKAVGRTELSRRTLLAPLSLTVLLLLLSFMPRMQENATLALSFQAAAGVLLLWQVMLYINLKRANVGRAFILAKPRPQHYLQAMVHLSIYAYWGWYWEPVYHYAWLLLGQLVFAYAVDMLLSWSRRENYLLGFGPFPIIFSTNLFLWFRDDWFYLQFLMVAVGFAGKEFVRWNRDGRSTHIFNPSAFTLGLFSLVLITTNTTDLTWGPEIASTLSLAPGIYTYLFLCGLVVMYFFSITLVAASAAMTLFMLSALYSTINGVPYFLDSEIPTAVFLGLHLLVTDPSTSPRTPPGKLIFGILYGLGVFALYSLLSQLGAPTFYDKLLCVPLLNLGVQWIDRLARSIHYTPVLSRLGLDAAGGRANLAHMAVWIVFFAGMSLLGKTDSRHTGDSLPFWEKTCTGQRSNACDRLILLETTYCGDGSGWACNELGAYYLQGRYIEQDKDRAMTYFSQACELHFKAACLNLLEPDRLTHAQPRELDLRLLLREGGRNLMQMPEHDLYVRACEHGWAFACEKV